MIPVVNAQGRAAPRNHHLARHDGVALRDVLDRTLLRAAREVRLLAAVTPTNLAEERERLRDALTRRMTAVPRFVYGRADRSPLRRTLAALRTLVASAVPSPVDALYHERIDELDLEARIAESTGTADLGALARERFAERAPWAARRADTLARRWLHASVPASEDRVPSDDRHDPRSLVAAMRREVSRRGVAFRVEIAPLLFCRAATGDATIWVAEGQLLRESEVRRTVVHEMDGHVMPRARAAARAPLFSIGTARSADDQEGLALLAEERAGLLDGSRQRELAARHTAARAMFQGAEFEEVTRGLIADHGLTVEEALAVAARTYRGSARSGPGLGREAVYLPAYLRVRRHLQSRPEDEATLGSGQVSLDAIPSLL